MTAPPTLAGAAQLVDAIRFVIDLARPNTPKVHRERACRQLLLRLHGPDPRRAELLRDAARAASYARDGGDTLRRLQAARELILHPPTTTPAQEHQP